MDADPAAADADDAAAVACDAAVVACDVAVPACCVAVVACCVAIAACSFAIDACCTAVFLDVSAPVFAVCACVLNDRVSFSIGVILVYILVILEFLLLKIINLYLLIQHQHTPFTEVDIVLPVFTFNP